MESMHDWSQHADEWLARDHALLTGASGFRTRIDRPDLQVWSQPMPDDPNQLFRWRLPSVGAPAEIVFEGFVHRLLDYHREWTREFAGGRVVDSPASGARILYQRFEPGIPGIAPRDLCSIEVVRELSPGIKLASFRSIDRLPLEAGYVRIDWWGAVLCRTREGGKDSELIYLDRENQGGRFPAWLMNRMMTKYLVVQAEQVRRFFSDGGPSALRQATHEPARSLDQSPRAV
jgi:hypothetical protein